MLGPRTALATFALTLATLLAACGGGDEHSSTPATSDTAETAVTTGEGESGTCTAIQELEVDEFGAHSNRNFEARDYETTPPSGGDHNPVALAAGSFYPKPPRLGESVHLLEHGAVIGWTNGLDRADQRAVEDAFNDVFQAGYYQLAVIENPDLETPFALSAWGYLQSCEEADASVIGPFVEQHYAPSTSGESLQACQGEARRLPPCRELTEG